MPEPESHTLAWMRKVDAKLAELAADVSAFRSETQAALAQLRDEVMVTSAICLRLEAREVRPRASWRSTSG
jgi:recombinational DNA repair ATPase RecF